MSRNIRVMVVDDHEIVRTGVAAAIDLEPDLIVVAAVGTGEAATAAMKPHTPDVVVLDLRLGDTSGVDVCRTLVAENPSVAVLLFTAFADREALVGALDAGAKGYILKRISTDRLVAGIRAAADGEQVLDPEAQDILDRISIGGSVDAGLEILTAQERIVLDRIAEGLTNRQISASMDLTEKTVKNYVSNVLRKLEVSSRSEAAVIRASIRRD